MDGEGDTLDELRDGLNTSLAMGTGSRVGTIVQANGKKYICFEVKSSDEEDK